MVLMNVLADALKTMLKRGSRAPGAHACNPATQEAEIRRLAVQGQVGQMVRETLS
jgi:hypothetical protein